MTKSLVSYNTIILPSPDKLRFSPPNPANPVAIQIAVCRATGGKKGLFINKCGVMKKAKYL